VRNINNTVETNGRVTQLSRMQKKTSITFHPTNSYNQDLLNEKEK
jgi:hypothetical protein